MVLRQHSTHQAFGKEGRGAENALELGHEIWKVVRPTQKNPVILKYYSCCTGTVVARHLFFMTKNKICQTEIKNSEFMFVEDMELDRNVMTLFIIGKQ